MLRAGSGMKYELELPDDDADECGQCQARASRKATDSNLLHFARDVDTSNSLEGTVAGPTAKAPIVEAGAVENPVAFPPEAASFIESSSLMAST